VCLICAANRTLRRAQGSEQLFNTTAMTVSLKQFQTSQLLIPMTSAARPPSSFVSFYHPAEAAVPDPMLGPSAVIQASRNCVVSIPKMVPGVSETATAEHVHQLLEARGFELCAIEVRFSRHPETSALVGSARIAFDTDAIAQQAASFLRSLPEFSDTHVSTCASHAFHVRVLERVGMSGHSRNAGVEGMFVSSQCLWGVRDLCLFLSSRFGHPDALE
jgi:hypothetical protein